MLLARRNLLIASVPVLLTPTQALQAQEPTKAFDPIAEWGFSPPVPAATGPGVAPTGTKPPQHGEIAKAFRLLYMAPRNKTPVQIARYFERLKDKNGDNQPYNYEWPKDGRANPLIVGFFSATFTTPNAGDQTAWCAAFVNFCLMAAGKPTTGSAQSGSFRNNANYPSTEKPKMGDIVVFRKTGPEGDKGFGHVGLYLSETATEVTVLGGNQVGNTGSTGAVTVSKYAFKSASLELHSYRTV